MSMLLELKLLDLQEFGGIGNKTKKPAFDKAGFQEYYFDDLL
jgi:hypothetical protein